MAIQDLLDDGLVSEEKRVKVLPWFVPLVFLLASPLITVWLGLAHWSEVRSFSIVSLVVKFLLLFCFVTFCFVWPMHRLVWQRTQNWPVRSFAFTYCALLMVLPLVGFFYYLGRYREPLSFQEPIVTLLPAVVLSLLMIVRTGRAAWAGMCLTLAVYFPLFVCNEILGPFTTAFSLLSNGSGYYLIRTVIAGVALGWTIALGERTSPEPSRLRYVVAGVCLVWGAGLGVVFKSGTLPSQMMWLEIVLWGTTVLVFVISLLVRYLAGKYHGVPAGLLTGKTDPR